LIKQHICTIVEKKKEFKIKEKSEKNNIFIETLKKTTEYQIQNPQTAPVVIDDKFLFQNSRNIKLNMDNVKFYKGRGIYLLKFSKDIHHQMES